MATVELNIYNLVNFQSVPPDWPGGFWWHWLFFTVVIIGFVLTMVMGVIYIERRGMARMQSRLGPNRTGPFGLLQPVADAIKVLLKENIVPEARSLAGPGDCLRPGADDFRRGTLWKWRPAGRP